MVVFPHFIFSHRWLCASRLSLACGSVLAVVIPHHGVRFFCRIRAMVDWLCGASPAVYLAGCLFLVPCWAAGKTLDRIVAIVNDDVVTQSELQLQLTLVQQQLQLQGDELPAQDILYKQVLDSLIQDRLQMQMAKRMGIYIDDAALQAAAADIARNNQVSPTDFRRQMEDDGHDYDRFLSGVRDELTIQRLHQRSVHSRIVVSDREIEDFLASQELQQDGDPEVRLSHILITWPEGSSESEIEDYRQQAESVRQQLIDGADFATLARQVSKAQTAQLGGDLGWRKFSQLPSLFTDYVPLMASGEISTLIEAQDGFHIIYLRALRQEDNMTEEQVQVRHILIRVDEVDDEETVRGRLSLLRQRILSGDDFAALAKAHSEDPVSAIKGGDLGWNNLRVFAPRFADAIRALEESELSEPFETNFGWHIAEVLGWREYDNTESIRRGQARRSIFARKLQEAHRKWNRNLRDEAYVEYRLE